MDASTMIDRINPEGNGIAVSSHSRPSKSAWNPEPLPTIEESPPILRTSAPEGTLGPPENLEDWFSWHEEFDAWLVHHTKEHYSALRNGDAWFFSTGSAWWYVEKPPADMTFPLYDDEVLPFQVFLKQAIVQLLRKWEGKLAWWNIRFCRRGRIRYDSHVLVTIETPDDPGSVYWTDVKERLSDLLRTYQGVRVRGEVVSTRVDVNGNRTRVDGNGRRRRVRG